MDCSVYTRLRISLVIIAYYAAVCLFLLFRLFLQIHFFFFLLFSFYFLCFDYLHPLYFWENNMLAIFKRMFCSWQQRHDSFLCLANILDHDIDRIFSVFINNFEILTEIIK